MLPQGKGHVLGHRHAVEQGGLLEEEAEADALVGELPLVQFGQVPPLEEDLAAAGPQQADDRLQQHRLAAAALADDRQGLAAGDAQIDVAQHRLLREIDAQHAPAAAAQRRPRSPGMRRRLLWTRYRP